MLKNKALLPHRLVGQRNGARILPAAKNAKRRVCERFWHLLSPKEKGKPMV